MGNVGVVNSIMQRGDGMQLIDIDTLLIIPQVYHSLLIISDSVK